MDTEEYYGGCYPEPPEYEEEQADWNEYQWELADIHHDELMLEKALEEKYPAEKQLKLFKEQDVTIYKLQKDLKLSHTTLYNYAKGKRKVESMDVAMANKIAKYFNMSIEDLYDKMKKYEKEREM